MPLSKVCLCLSNLLCLVLCVCVGEVGERIHACSLAQQCQPRSADLAEEQCEYVCTPMHIFPFVLMWLCVWVKYMDSLINIKQSAGRATQVLELNCLPGFPTSPLKLCSRVPRLFHSVFTFLSKKNIYLLCYCLTSVYMFVWLVLLLQFFFYLASPLTCSAFFLHPLMYHLHSIHRKKLL